MTKKILGSISIFTLFIATLVLVYAPQSTLSLSIGSFVLSIWFIFPIFYIGIPELRDKITNSNIVKITPIISVLLPYLVLSIFAGKFIDFSTVIFWYLLPILLFILPVFFDELSSKINSIIYIIAATILWIGFDHRYTSSIFREYSDIGYLMNSLWMAHVGFVSYGIIKGMNQEGVIDDKSLQPTIKGVIIANKITPVASILIIPLGLITGFLIWNPVEFDILMMIVSFIGIFITIALQEEMIFRGIILHESDNYMNNKTSKILSLIIVSAAFAFTHWNNEIPEYVWLYFITAFIAGIAYGLSYRFGGLFSAMLSHTLIDWFWALLLKRV